MERLAIIDHVSHTLYIEDVSDDDLEKYKGEEEDYIRDNYTFEGAYSWDWIVDGEYLPVDDKTPYDLNEIIDNGI